MLCQSITPVSTPSSSTRILSRERASWQRAVVVGCFLAMPEAASRANALSGQGKNFGIKLSICLVKSNIWRSVSLSSWSVAPLSRDASSDDANRSRALIQSEVSEKGPRVWSILARSP